MRVSRGLAACLVGSAGVLVPLASCHLRSDVETERAALVAAFGPVRPFAGRLSGLPFAPRSAGPLPEPRDLEAWKLASRAVEARASADHPTPAALANRALVEILSGELGQAAASLEAAVHLPRPSARVWSDLAAVRLAQAGDTDDAKDAHRLVDALAAANRALALAPDLPEALFNRAEVNSRLELRGLAVADWKHYLALDARSRWAGEARAELGSLGEPSQADRWAREQPALEAALAVDDQAKIASLTKTFPDRVRADLEGTLFPRWAAAIVRDDAAEAARWARAAGTVGSLLRERTGDRLDEDAASAIASVPPALALVLAQAHLEYAEAVQLYGQTRYREARPRFATARGGFARARNPFSLWASFEIAACDYQLGGKDAGAAAAAAILPVARERSYLSLVGWIRWLTGLGALEHGKAERAHDLVVEARDAFKMSGESASLASMDSLLANCLTYLGSRDAAWRYRLDALAVAARAGDPLPQITIFSAAARALLQEDHTNEALQVQEEALELTKKLGDEQRIAEAHWWLALISLHRGDWASARQGIEEAQRHLDRAHDRDAVRDTQAGISATAGEIWLAADPRRALGSLGTALQLYQKSDYAYSRTALLLLRSRAHRALGENREAGADLEAAVGEYERQRGWVRSPARQVAYFEGARDAFDDLIAFDLDRLRDSDRAFDIAERSRSRALLASLAGRRLAPSRPLAAADVDRALAGTALVEYAVLDDRVVIWVRGTAHAVQQVPWKATAVEKAVAKLARSIDVPAGTDPKAAAAELERQLGVFFDRLIAPVLRDVPAGATLVLVPDGALRNVPFAALRDRHARSFLIERNPLVVAPSATVFLAAFRRGKGTPRASWGSLSVGGPKVDQRLFPEHGPLPAAEKEAQAVEMAHPGALLVEKIATAPHFLAKLDLFELIHFAGHAGVSPAGSRAALLFAPEAGRYRTGALDVDEIASQRLTRPRLAVLAACSAAGGARLGLEGGADLSRAFLQAGVPAVVGNLWTLGDAEATVFLDVFYASFWRGASATSALRDAQLAMIHNSDSSLRRPAVWGGFRLLGTAAGQ